MDSIALALHTSLNNDQSAGRPLARLAPAASGAEDVPEGLLQGHIHIGHQKVRGEDRKARERDQKGKPPAQGTAA